MSRSRPQIYSGLHAVAAILRHRPEAVLELWVLEERLARGEARLTEVADAARALGISVQPAGRQALERKAGPQHQGVVARARPRSLAGEQDLTAYLQSRSSPLVLALDGITDPHNLGACLRGADGAGVDAVILPERNSAGLTAVACRSAAGAAESCRVFQVGNLARALAGLREQGLRVVGAAGNEAAVPMHELGPEPSGQVLVMGAEGSGLRPVTHKQCDSLVAIPLRGEVESLNVSVATAVLLYQLTT